MYTYIICTESYCFFFQPACDDWKWPICLVWNRTTCLQLAGTFNDRQIKNKRYDKTILSRINKAVRQQKTVVSICIYRHIYIDMYMSICINTYIDIYIHILYIHILYIHIDLLNLLRPFPNLSGALAPPSNFQLLAPMASTRRMWTSILQMVRDCFFQMWVPQNPGEVLETRMFLGHGGYLEPSYEAPTSPNIQILLMFASCSKKSEDVAWLSWWSWCSHVL